MFLFTVLFLFLSPVKSTRTGRLTRPVQMIWILWNDVLVRKQMHYVNIMRQIVAYEAGIVKNGATLFVLFL